MKRFVFCVLVVVVLTAPSVAKALTCASDCVFNYQLEFSGPIFQYPTQQQVGTVTVNLSGQLTTSNQQVVNPPGGGIGYDILSIAGTSTITGLAAPYSSSISGLVALGSPYDNILYFPAATLTTGGFGYFDGGGVTFEDASNTFYNLVGDVPGYGTGDSLIFFFLPDDVGGPLNLEGENISPVPEPSIWVMLLLGFTSIGFMAHRHKRRAAYSSF
jgi:hypothetical protein